MTRICISFPKMSTRSGSQVTTNIKNEFPTFHDFTEHCEFCILSFQTRAELKAHIFTHFKSKTCLKTQKNLILIADDWFELHINDRCTSELCDSEKVSSPVHLSEYMIKEVEEEEDAEKSLVNDYVANDEASNNVFIRNGDVNDSIVNNETSSNVSIRSEDEADINVDSSATASSEKNVKKADTRTKNSKKSKVPSPSSQTKKSFPKAKTIKCKICKMKIAQAELILHLTTRHIPKINEIPTCETCGKTFSTPGNLRSHQYLHAERRRYICSYCGKDFVRHANLKEHINLHTGARPFVCDICEKTFHRETLLRNHKRIHTGERKYRCDIENCERAYMVHIDLKRHKFSAHGIYTKKHTCFICSKVFSENKLLKKHLEAH